MPKPRVSEEELALVIKADEPSFVSSTAWLSIDFAKDLQDCREELKEALHLLDPLSTAIISQQLREKYGWSDD